MKKITPKITKTNASNLMLDGKNPRLPASMNTSNQEKIWEFMRKAYDLEELALSIVTNGYFEAEPMVVIPFKESFKSGQEEQYREYTNNPDSQYIVVEGNRRLSTIQGLIRNVFPDIPLDPAAEEQFEKLPVVVYPNRDDVLAFLGVHHLAGVRKWNVYERVLFIVNLMRNKKISLEEIQKIIGDRKNSARKNYGCYRLIEIVEEYDESFDTRKAKRNFSYLQLATGQESIRRFIGLPVWKHIEDIESPIPDSKKEDLRNLLSWLFGDGSISSIITDSRQITSQLDRVLNDSDGVKILQETRDLNNAFEFIGGDLVGMVKLSSQAQKKLEIVNGKLSSLDVLKTLEKEDGGELKQKIDAIQNIVKDILKKYND